MTTVTTGAKPISFTQYIWGKCKSQPAIPIGQSLFLKYVYAHTTDDQVSLLLAVHWEEQLGT